MSEISIAQSICRSIRLIESVGSEVDSMREMIRQQIGEAISLLPEHMKITDAWKEVFCSDESGWINIDSVDHIGVAPRRGKKVRYLSIQISLAGDGVSREPNDNDVPLIHICWWECPANFNEDYFSFEDSLDEARILDQYLIEYENTGETCMDRVWMYSIELTTINSIDDIRTKIVEPFKKIILGFDISEIGFSNLDGIVKYRIDEDGFLSIIRPEPRQE